MSSVLGTRMELIKTLLEAKYPARVVTRNFIGYADHKRTDLVKGIYTLVSQSEGGYPNYNGREGQDGRQRLLLVGQFILDEDALGSAIEEAEFIMAEEIKEFLRTRDPQIAQLFMTGFRQSQQLDRPYGWIAVDLEFLQ